MMRMGFVWPWILTLVLGCAAIGGGGPDSEDRATPEGGLIAIAKFGALFEHFTPQFEIVRPGRIR